ncbi:S8 family serine peptidase [Aquimarina sp. U1-2]|uniref:S8 family serine peptidase n=1 Tax=Aquimarina sp. U1-2 TaxID=2823141 RepID=UPI001AECF5A6|nr:S8 family serine peptidase [Aquimarina sp. U1-2]MBP2833666.1 S8 family serine peptidase [Aquimarina sp. U1-2]
MKNKLFLLLLCLCSCIAQNTNTFSKNIIVVDENKRQIKGEIIKSWQHKDIFEDTIQGMSVERAYSEILSKKRGNTVIVAVIDGGTDIEHEDLKDQIWVNEKEIPNNNIDDDKNGYVDDIHGWNFLGSTNGENQYYARWEFVRILTKKGLLTKEGLEQPKEEKDSLILEAIKFYQNAKNTLDTDLRYIEEQNNYLKEIREKLKNYFPNQNYNFETLKTIDTLKNPELSRPARKLHEFLTYGLTQESLDEYAKYVYSIRDYKLNYAYKDRKISNDNVEHFNDTNYGNNIIIEDKSIDTHGTSVSGLIAATRNNNIGIDGIADHVKLMILRTVPQGDEYDKDVALAIRYAVDNGAKVINMSFGKFFSPQKEMVFDAIQYAAEKDVVLVHGSGNDGKNLDVYNFYPLDYTNSEEFANNFINVGALNTFLDHRLPAYFSNYGKKNLDVFAPGKDLYTTAVNNKYVVEDGTSLAAPLVSGVAAVIRSRYPDLSASQVKHIILESGNSYNINVRFPGNAKGPKAPFSDLSKSGKVVNLYNALLMAEQISKKQK